LVFESTVADVGSPVGDLDSLVEEQPAVTPIAAIASAPAHNAIRLAHPEFSMGRRVLRTQVRTDG
jgi:hypothetical protein